MDQQTNGAEANIIALPMDFTIDCVHTLHATITAALARPLALALDATNVDRCDTAGMQLLLAAQRSGAARQQPVQITHAPPHLLAVAEGLGLTAALGLSRSESNDA